MLLYIAKGADNSNMFKTEYLRAMAGLRDSAAGAVRTAPQKMVSTWEYISNEQQRSA